MSLEATLKENTAALDRNTAALLGKAPAKAPAAETKTEAPPAGKPGRPAKPKGVTKEQIAEKAGELKDAQGMPAVRALFKEAGSKTGKIDDVPEKSYPALLAALEGALEPAEDGDEAEEGDDDSL